MNENIKYKYKKIAGELLIVALFAAQANATDMDICLDLIDEEGKAVVSQMDCNDPNAAEVASFKIADLIHKNGCRNFLSANEMVKALRKVYDTIPSGCGGYERTN